MKNISKILILIALLSTVFVFECFGQVTDLRGTVTDEESGASLSNVRIFFNGELQGTANDRGEFHLRFAFAIENTDMVRFWKVGHYFQTFQISKIENKNDMRIKLTKGEPFNLSLFNGGGEVIEVSINNERLSKEELDDYNPKEMIYIELHPIDTDNPCTAKYFRLNLVTQ